MNKALLIPIIALLALIAKQAFGYELSQVEIDIVIEGVLSIVTLVGLFMNPKKEGDNQ